MNFLLLMFGCLCGTVIFWGVIRKENLYRVTFFMGLTFAGFALPQLIGIWNAGDSALGRALEDGALDMLLLMCLLCLGAVWFGDYQGVQHPGRAPIETFGDYDTDRLI